MSPRAPVFLGGFMAGYVFAIGKLTWLLRPTWIANPDLLAAGCMVLAIVFALLSAWIDKRDTRRPW